MNDDTPGRSSRLGMTLPALTAWFLMVGLLIYQMLDRGSWSREADRANLREWLTESRVGSKTLGDVAGEYLDALADGPAAVETAASKREELGVFLESLGDPTRRHQNQLPLFPKVYRMEVRFHGAGIDVEPVAWESFVPRSEPSQSGPVCQLEPVAFGRAGLTAEMTCVYELHAYSRHQADSEQRQRNVFWSACLFTLASFLGGFYVYRVWRREWKRDLRVLRAERSAAEMKSQVFAGIGIMAGSYAHNIKNLLVRPNDLLDRLLDSEGMTDQQRRRVGEVRETLKTVTERLQQILKTVRRDPAHSELDRVDLNVVLEELTRAWGDMAAEKWKLRLQVEPGAEPLWVRADVSHLQQAVENLLFNARDAVFEMRNYRRELAYREDDPDARRKAIREAAGWKGAVEVRAFRAGDRVVLEVRDDGIGMEDEVRHQCLGAHFSTKRDNALYAGLNAGSGLGLSFVTAVLEHHGAALEIASAPLTGTTFRVAFPAE